MTVRKMKASFMSNKGALTHLNGAVKIRAKTFIGIKFPASATALNEAYNKFLAKSDFLHRAAHQLALKDDANAQTWQTAQNQLQPLQEQIERIYAYAQVQVGMAAQPHETGSVAPGASRVRIRMDLKPWNLLASATPTEFRTTIPLDSAFDTTLLNTFCDCRSSLNLQGFPPVLPTTSAKSILILGQNDPVIDIF